MEHFNWKVYIQNYPDLQFMKTQQQAVNHWKRHGKNENRTDKDKIFKDINLEDIINQITYYKYMFKDSSFIYK